MHENKEPARAALRPLHLLRAVARRRPLYSQLIVTRRCNLSCGYCHEYDQRSEPVPLAALRDRIAALHRLGTFHICLLGGEPLLHPQLDEVVAAAAGGAQVSVITNGFLLRDELIERLGQAGLFAMQVSVDTLRPDADLYIQKSLKTVRRRLLRLRELARFKVLVSMVLCERSRPEFEDMMQEVRDMGLPLAVSIVHDADGRIAVEGPEYVRLYERFHDTFQVPYFVEFGYGRALLRGERPDWHCRAGSRYLYVDEHGKVQLCPSQLGRIGKRIEEYGLEDLRDQHQRRKGCESGCSVMCVYRASSLDNAPLHTARTMLRGVVRSSW